MSEVEAYCPDCQEELTSSEYDFGTGCDSCGCEELFLSPDAFVDLVQNDWNL